MNDTQQEHPQHHHGTDFKFMVGFFIGGLVGALVIFFLGTKEGKKAGRFLRQKGEDVIDELEDKVEELEKKGKIRKRLFKNIPRKS
ncbi:MAG: hypothetical protein UY49_C0036G0008 [Microgenomates group bacterium GW2011_GWC1_49_7]|nr:MAG: hypothetical protein UY49_C0036G0008 [Microgenomates group bacterium GW2011_GWC1_49_7]